MNEYTINFLINDKDLGKRIDLVLAKKSNKLSRNRIQSLIIQGKVTFNSQIISNQAFKINEIGNLVITIPPIKKLDIKPQKMELDIIYEDSDLIVVNKEAGVVVHPAAGNFENTLVNGLLFHCKNTLSGIGGVERPGIVHRLDKMTSGLIVVAKNDNTHFELSKQFKNRTTTREYRAIVLDKLEKDTGILSSNIIRSKNNRKIMTTTSKNQGKSAITNFELIEEFVLKDNSILNYIKCILKTGRTHQIRVHMKKLGNSLLGDLTYGKRVIYNKNKIDQEIILIIENEWYSNERHALHAKKLGFYHPIKKKDMFFDTKLPIDFSKLIKILRINRINN